MSRLYPSFVNTSHAIDNNWCISFANLPPNLIHTACVDAIKITCINILLDFFFIANRNDRKRNRCLLQNRARSRLFSWQGKFIYPYKKRGGKTCFFIRSFVIMSQLERYSSKIRSTDFVMHKKSIPIKIFLPTC